jgi:hypothetical protein
MVTFDDQYVFRVHDPTQTNTYVTSDNQICQTADNAFIKSGGSMQLHGRNRKYPVDHVPVPKTSNNVDVVPIFMMAAVQRSI